MSKEHDMKRNKGAALIVGLVLLLVLTILGIVSMKAARFQLLMTGNEQFHIQALNAAESAIEVQIADGNFQPTFLQPSNPVSIDMPGITGTSTIEFMNTGIAPNGGFSDDMLTYRFRIDAEGEAPADDPRAHVELRQGIYILAP